MTAATRERTAKPSPKAAPQPRRSPKLRVVHADQVRRARRRRTIVSLSTVALVVTLFATAILYGQIVEGQRHIDELRAEIARAEADQARLERDIAVSSTPEAIVARAKELGMVRSVDPQYLVAVRAADS